MEFDKFKFFIRVLENMNPDELQEYGPKLFDRHIERPRRALINRYICRACWIPNCVVRFVDNKTYLLNNIEFIGQSINESWVDPMSGWSESGPMTTPRPSETKSLTTTEKIVRREFGVPMDLELPQESDDDFELIYAVIRYIKVKTWDLNFRIMMELTQ